MSNRKIYAIGETVLDLIFRNHQPIAAKAGGAMLNSCISLGRLDLPVHFISEYGQDETGNTIDDFLKQNKVSTEFVSRYTDGKTALALAYLDENNNANYEFYKEYPEKRLQINFPVIKKDDIVIFGSFYALTSQIRRVLLKIIQNAQKNHAIIIYDPNFRKPHIDELAKLLPLIKENIQFSTIIRGSDEDFSCIFNENTPEQSFKELNSTKKILIYTRSSKKVFVQTSRISESYPIKKIIPVSTIGAGDTFNAGIIYSLYRHNITFEEVLSISPQNWAHIINTAIDFATEVCMSLDNYISNRFAENYKI